ncbi:hypothetical protein ACWKWC_20695 [Geodermatophilus nigrescens]|uniref:Uncharacterized protein n=1 Tax=Geodermatophilus nigrescens TaxID=1070870 RepID=A0A1M5F4N2_9ACTN|nr:hypothetical protein [Geodermatophilus nigrescens]SHF86348.1 hypothetical protein SAMN05444351_1069 [Geodermatophilus nigrescens]
MTTTDDLAQDASVEEAVARLVAEFRMRPQVVGTVVASCRRDLSGVPATALPELVERLARTRLESVG